MIVYTIRLLFQNQDESKGVMVEMQASDPILPTVGSHLAFHIFNRYIMFEVSMVVHYPGTDMQTVIVAKPFKTSDEGLMESISSSIKMACDGERLVYRHTKDLVSKIS